MRAPRSRTSAQGRIDRQTVNELLQSERADFLARNPASQRLSRDGAATLLFGVPLHWMTDWGTPFTVHVREAHGAQLQDVDGHTLLDFCLGDTGAMFGHAPPAVVQALRQQAGRGMTTMLPGEDAAPVGALLQARFGLSHWQFATTASDANRFVLRWLRAASGRDKILVFNGCYHGTVDDVFVDLIDGQPRQRDSLLGQVHDLTAHSKVVEFNDLEALDAVLARGDVAAVVAEPAMTNVGMVLPDAGFWAQAQTLIRRSGAALVLDETHTISCGPGGYTASAGLRPDVIVLGKAVGAGLPCAAYGFSSDWAERVVRAKRAAPPGHSGIGTTLSGGLLAMAAMRATLENLLIPSAYAPMLENAARLEAGLQGSLARRALPWCVTRLGARCEFQFCASPPRNGSEARAAMDDPLEQLIHLALLNRGVLITPFHNMMLVSPVTGSSAVDDLLAAFDEVLDGLCRA